MHSYKNGKRIKTTWINSYNFNNNWTIHNRNCYMHKHKETFPKLVNYTIAFFHNHKLNSKRSNPKIPLIEIVKIPMICSF